MTDANTRKAIVTTLNLRLILVNIVNALISEFPVLTTTPRGCRPAACSRDSVGIVDIAPRRIHHWG